MDYENTEIDEYIIDCQFLPCINWFKISIDQKYLNFDIYERWKKMSFGNRCTLLGGGGLIQLSVPVEKGRDQKALFRDIKISYLENWQLKFWRTIVSCYNRAPFFEFYKDELQETLMKKHTFLMDLNMELISLCFKYLNDSKVIRIIDGNKMIKIDSLEHYLLPKNSQALPSPITYHQMFSDRHGFQANLSILDLLFMEGPEAKYLLSK